MTTERLETKVQCHFCGRYGTRGFRPDPVAFGKPLCVATKACMDRWFAGGRPRDAVSDDGANGPEVGGASGNPGKPQDAGSVPSSDKASHDG